MIAAADALHIDAIHSQNIEIPNPHVCCIITRHTAFLDVVFQNFSPEKFTTAKEIDQQFFQEL